MVRTKNARYTMVTGWTKYGVRVHTVTSRVILTVPTHNALRPEAMSGTRTARHTVIKATHYYLATARQSVRELVTDVIILAVSGV